MMVHCGEKHSIILRVPAELWNIIVGATFQTRQSARRSQEPGRLSPAELLLVCKAWKVC
jgi:hypothetical protein